MSKPPPAGTQDAQLPALLAARLLYSQESPIPSNDEAKESTPKPIHQEVTKMDFEVFYCEDALCTLAARTSIEIGLEEKTLDLLALLTAYAGGFFPAIAMTPRPPTTVATCTSPADAADKK